jgi:uncharacterized repeat protein (TIGR03803 family)
MKHLYSLVGACLSAALLTACGGSGVAPSSGLPGAMPGSRGLPPGSPAHAERHPSVAYAMLYSFKGGSGDGSEPSAPLRDVKGTLYGTTDSGGSGDCNNGCGTVFAITTSGTESVLYSFKGGSGDGWEPGAVLRKVKGMLYSTTFDGGANGDGTVFAITTSGAERLLYSFKGGSGDGANPEAGLRDVKGTLYGATEEGGANGLGTVFALTTSGKESVLHSFGGSGDGANPYEGLLNVKGTLYGTTPNGGANCTPSGGCGTVFAITTSGTESVLHSFGGSGDGATTYATLVNVNGTLYGATYDGGANGDGTVFAIMTSGKESVLYSFKGGSGDGANPIEALIKVKSKLYGTTFVGGANGLGTVFALTTSGKESVLHSFGGSGDGTNPYAGLVNVNGTLYGATYTGGANNAGTVFSITP